jgi:hypothetical protein
MLATLLAALGDGARVPWRLRVRAGAIETSAG